MRQRTLGRQPRACVVIVRFLVKHRVSIQLCLTLARCIYNCRLRDRLRVLVGEWAGPRDWFHLGVPKWLADRLDRLGFTWPTEARAE